MNIEKDIHPSILAALNGQEYEVKESKVNLDDGETLTVERFTFGDQEPTLLIAIKAIIELSENCELSNVFFSKPKRHSTMSASVCQSRTNKP